MKNVKLDNLLVTVFDSDDLNSAKLYETLELLYKELDNHKLFIMDLSNIKHLREEAVGSLIYLQQYLRERRKSLRMYQTREKILEVYQKLHLEKIMSMANSAGKDDSEDLIFYIN